MKSSMAAVLFLMMGVFAQALVAKPPSSQAAREIGEGPLSPSWGELWALFDRVYGAYSPSPKA